MAILLLFVGVLVLVAGGGFIYGLISEFIKMIREQNGTRK